MFFLGEARLPVLPTPTLAGLRAVQEDIGIIPTYPPQRQDILKRFSGDPAICGWAEGNAGKHRKMENADAQARIINLCENRQYRFMQFWTYLRSHFDVYWLLLHRSFKLPGACHDVLRQNRTIL